MDVLNDITINSSLTLSSITISPIGGVKNTPALGTITAFYIPITWNGATYKIPLYQ
jgi:hypothetical protein